MSFSYDDSRDLDMCAYQMVLADFPRGLQRALISSLANGTAPYTEEEAEKNQIRINVNDLTMTRLAQAARLQYTNGFFGQGRYFSARTDMGPKHKRSLFSAIVSKEANLPLKESIQHYESMQARFGSLVLHGIGASVFETQDMVISKALGVEDVLIPGRTLLGFQNLPYFMLRMELTAVELRKLSLASKRDPGWNMDLVRRCEEWMDSEMTQMAGDNWTDSWSPEKWEERAKEDVGISAGDEVPAIRCFDIYGYKEASGKEPAGWVRRIILDSWSTPAISGGRSISMSRNDKMKDKKGNSLQPTKKGDFLFSSGDHRVAENWNQVVSFQFADLSAVTPRRYHSTRGLGWMLYAACHLKNRMVCKTQEAVFEALLQYFRVKSADDIQRAMKIELANMGIIDETITPVPAAERWQPNVGLVEFGLNEIQQCIENNARSTTGQPEQKKERESNFQRMADIQQVNALVSAGLNQAYQYQVFEYRENFRRLLKVNSKDPLARAFRERCLRQGVPEDLLVAEAWDIQSERMMGGGNQTLETMIAQSMLELVPQLDPEPQRIVKRDYVLAMTKNPAKALELVPETPVISDSIHDTEAVFGTLMGGTPVTPKSGLNSQEVAATTLKLMAMKVQHIMQTGGVGTPADVTGLQTAGQYAQAYIQMLAQDKQMAPMAKKLGDALGKLMNEVKAMAQRQQEQAKAASKAQQNGQAQPKPQDLVKARLDMEKGKQKLSLAQQSHAQKQAHKQIEFEQKLAMEGQQHQADIAAKDLETAASVHREGLRSMNEDSDES